MMKYNRKLITAGLVLVFLAAALFMGCDSSQPEQATAITTVQDAGRSTESDPSAPAGETIEADPSAPDSVPLPSEPDTTEAPKEESAPPAGTDSVSADPVPESVSQPAEPQSSDSSGAVFTCTLTVRCYTILDNIARFDKEKNELLPKDGVLFQTAEVAFYEGESVFNILQREMRRTKTHLVFRSAPINNSAYIEAIGNIYEFDCGELSGWMYKVNNWFPNYSCSRYQLQEGDSVEWLYSCDLGRDIGGGYASGKQVE